MRLLTAAIQSAVRPSCHTAPATSAPSLATAELWIMIITWGQIAKLGSYNKKKRGDMMT